MASLEEMFGQMSVNKDSSSMRDGPVPTVERTSRPERTYQGRLKVTILVCMHGEDIKTTQGGLECELYSVPPGICGFIHSDIPEEITRIKSFQRFSGTELVQHYKDYFTHDRGRRLATVRDSFIWQTHGEGAAAVEPLYRSLKQLTPRKITTDRIYSCDTDKLGSASGIFLLDVCDDRGPLSRKPDLVGRKIHLPITSTFIETLVREGKIPHYTGDMRQIHMSSMGQMLQEYQGMNLLNVDVLQQLSFLMTGERHILDREWGDTLLQTTAVTGINHYDNVKLSHLLKFFKKLNVDLCVVFDESCRMNSTQSDMTEVLAGYEEMRDAPRFPEPKGGRTRRKRRSRKSKKRS